MIKLIASDVDGTLIKDSTPVMYPEMLEAIKEMSQKGILFCAASGRQLQSLQNVFRGVAEDIAYIAENGALIKYKGQNIVVTAMKREYVEGIVKQLRQYSSSCDLLVSTPQECLVESKNMSFINLLTYGYRNHFRLVEDVLKVDTDVIKISIYQEESVRQLGEAVLIPAWQDKVKVCMAGEEWVDFMDVSVDKGNGLIFLQNHLGIQKEETMAFGDNNNDIGMMHAAGVSYAVENAVAQVKEAARFQCPSYLDKGVYKTIKEFL